MTVLESTRDVELAAGCVEPLLSVLGTPASDVNATEARRASLVLAKIATLDPIRIGGGGRLANALFFKRLAAVCET